MDKDTCLKEIAKEWAKLGNMFMEEWCEPADAVDITKEYFSQFAMTNCHGQILMPARVPYPGKDWIVKQIEKRNKASSSSKSKEEQASSTSHAVPGCPSQLRAVSEWVVRVRKGSFRLFGLDAEGAKVSDVPLPEPSEEHEDCMYEVVVLEDNIADAYFTLGGDQDLVSCLDFTIESMGLKKAVPNRLPGENHA